MSTLTAALSAWEQAAARTSGSHGTLSHEITIRDLATGHTVTYPITPSQAADLTQRLMQETSR
ncbi:hypothetical protein AB0D10_05510 [Kitasatospora sp. NPDC048545]|uniref:hypothetical protein n=1 Tax=Kitasatospora sp. NPDC048545 TaxID=3157208 RepID=UPI0033CC77EE